MLASVLNSPTAIQASIAIVQAFVRLRQILSSHVELARKLSALEKKYDSQFKVVFDAIRQLYGAATHQTLEHRVSHGAKERTLDSLPALQGQAILAYRFAITFASLRDAVMIAVGFNPRQNSICHSKCATNSLSPPSGGSSARESLQTLVASHQWHPATHESHLGSEAKLAAHSTTDFA